MPEVLVVSEAEAGLSLAVVSAYGVRELGPVPVGAGFHAGLHPHLPVAYLTSGDAEGAVVGVRVADALGEVARVTEVGGFPCHLAVSADGGLLATANYQGGSVSFVSLRDGMPGEVRSTVRLPYDSKPGQDAERQTQAYPHTVRWVGGAVLVPDLGGDVVWRVDAATGRVTEAYGCPAGSGPRHLAEDRRGRLWVSLELSGEVGLLAPRTLTAPASRAVAGEGVRNYPGDIVAAGRWVVMANRGADTLAIYDGDSDETGLVDEIGCGGAWPAALAVVDETVAVANRESGSVAFFEVSDSGLDAGEVLPCPCPIALVPLPTRHTDL